MSSFQRLISGRLKRRLASCLLVAGALVGVAQPQSGPAQPPAQERRPRITVGGESSDRLSRKQQQELLKHNLEKMKEDVNELVALAETLQTEINNASENILSVQVVEKADKIEKLAKRIKNTAKGF